MFSKCRRWWLHRHACIYIYTNTTAGPTSRVGESSMLIFTTGAVGRRLQHPVWRRDLIVETHGISNSIPFVADISMERLHQYVNGLHHYGVEGTTACQQGSWIHSIRRHNRNSIATSSVQAGQRSRWKSSCRIGELIRASKELSFPKDYKSRSSYSSIIGLFSYKSKQQQVPSICQAGYSLSTV